MHTSVPLRSDGPSARRRVVAYGLTVPAIAAGVLVGLLLVRADAPALAIVPVASAVAFCTWYLGLGAGLFALFQMAFAIDYFFIHPTGFARFASVGQLAAFLIFIAAWLAICIAADRVARETRRDRTRRIEAERASAQATRLTQLTAALAQARTPRSAVEATIQESLHALTADAGRVILIGRDGAQIDVARAVGYAQPELAEVATLGDNGPMADAVNRGVPVVIESREAWKTEYPAAPPSSRNEAFEASAIVPLLVGSRVVGVVQLEFERPRVLSLDDREYLIVVATYAAQALDRTWQLEYAERARSEAENLRAQADQELVERRTIEHALRASETRYRALAARTSRLHALSAALSEAVTTGAVVRAVIHHGSIVVGATAGEVALLVDDGAQLETLYAESLTQPETEPGRIPVEDGLCATEAVRTGRPVFVKSLADWQEHYWRSASVAADGGFESSATMPLLVEGAAIGVLAFHFTVPVNFDEEYQALLTSVAQHCAQALDRARLYESTQRARSEAEKANRIKDEFVSIVSHELRTPLNAILGWITMLQRGSLTGDKSARALQSIADNASRQARLIEDLLDFSRVSSGRASLELENVEMRELIRGVVESMTPTAVARAVELQLTSVPPVEVLGDNRRLEQVFFNLVDNAIKFTPNGGRVGIDVRIADGVVEVRVQDNGRGIDAEFLPLVFERFRQADSTSSRAYGGLGLGLSIAKQLVEAHKGSISAESAGIGCGATFTVRLPAAAQRDAFTGPVIGNADLVRSSSATPVKRTTTTPSQPVIDSRTS